MLSYIFCLYSSCRLSEVTEVWLFKVVWYFLWIMKLNCPGRIFSIIEHFWTVFCDYFVRWIKAQGKSLHASVLLLYVFGGTPSCVIFMFPIIGLDDAPCQYSAVPLYHGRFSLKYSQQTPHSSPVRASYEVSFVSSSIFYLHCMESSGLHQVNVMALIEFSVM